MNRNRIEKLLEEANALRGDETLDNDPFNAPWLDRFHQSLEQGVNRLNAMIEQMQWDDETVKQMQAILDDHVSWALASLGLCGKPEPRAKIRWFAIFPDWLALIPAELQLPALIELQKEGANHRRSWLASWLHSLCWGELAIPEGLTQEAMGSIVRTVVENSHALACFDTYCKKCALLYPMREHEFSGILPSCPNCGNVGHAYAHVFK